MNRRSPASCFALGFAMMGMACGGGRESSPVPNRAPDGTIVLPSGNASIAPGGSVDFQGACTDPDGDAVTHAWDFGGGAAASTTRSPGEITFGTAGAFTVTYTCTDARGLVDPLPDRRTITVATPGWRTLSGTATYDKVPSTAHGLDYALTAQRPIRGADVAVLDAASLSDVVATAVTDGDGRWQASWPSPGPASVRVVVFSRTHAPQVIVVDNTAGNAVYALASSPIDVASTSLVDLSAQSGWTGTGYSGRAAAPFAVLDAAWQAIRAFQGARPAVVFPDLRVNWSENNAPVGPQGGETQEQAYAAGHIWTTHWNGTELFVLGRADVDTDEFDDHVIVHEWGHYFDSVLGRDDSPGGSHGAGDTKDPRLAFSEGWANALSAFAWWPVTVYTDSSGPRQASGFGFDVQDNTSIDPAPGWFSEGSVQSILLDLLDADGGEPFDGVALGVGPIHDVMTGALRNSTALATIFTFIAALKSANPGQASSIDTLTRHRNVVGIPVLDAYGTGETNDGGHAVNLPLYRSLTPGSGATVTLLGGSSNSLGQNRFHRFTGDGAAHTVQIATSGGEDVDVVVYRQGVPVAIAAGASGNESTGLFLAGSGEELIAVVTGKGVSASYTTTVTLH